MLTEGLFIGATLRPFNCLYFFRSRGYFIRLWFQRQISKTGL